MGIEKNRTDQESLEQKPVNSIEQQEADPMIGLERASVEMEANLEQFAELSTSVGGAEALQGEDKEKFSELGNSLASKAEQWKAVLSEAGETLFVLAASTGGLLESFHLSANANKLEDLIPAAGIFAVSCAMMVASAIRGHSREVR